MPVDRGLAPPAPNLVDHCGAGGERGAGPQWAPRAIRRRGAREHAPLRRVAVIHLRQDGVNGDQRDARHDVQVPQDAEAALNARRLGRRLGSRLGARQFESAMRLLADGSGAQVYCPDYKLAPEYQWPVQIEEGEFVV